MDTLFCEWDTAQFLIFSDNVFGPLVYYSHFFAIILSLGIGFLVFLKDKKSLTGKILFFITIIFSLWVFSDLVLWASEKPDLIMFFWSLQVIIEPLIYAASVYFVDVFIEKKDISLGKKIGIASLIIPIILFASTKFALVGFNLSNCDREAIEGPITLYGYLIEIIYIGWIVIFGIKKSTQNIRPQIILITIGTVLFLASLSFGNIIGSFTDNWTVGQIGLFGVPIFVFFLGYLIVRYKAFNIKLLSSQLLIVSLSVLVFSISFIRKIENVRIVVGFTLFFVLFLGYILIRSVKREVEQREKLEILSTQLGEANEKLKGLDKLKTEFLSLASHQLRSPLTAIKGYTSMILEGDYGKISDKTKEAVDRVYESSKNLTVIVEDLLNVSKIEQGGMKYEMAPFSLAEIANDMAKDLSITAEKRGLKLSYAGGTDKECMVNGDKEKIRQVVLNFIDNAIKYTKTGTVDVSVHKKDDKVVFAVKDTGMGMTPEIKATLFQKFARGDGARMNTTGSGLGLYLAKEIVEAHKGRVWVESDGAGKGSTFAMELSAVK
ncbi:MAG: hypothetical protein KBB75_02145 [Candidatus Pacebacteria bacterium]|nr:hypothetical protein [Candidatus Paceibacterota bacterium]